MTPLEILTGAREHLAQGWCRGHDMMTAPDGHRRYCLRGAVLAAYNNHRATYPLDPSLEEVWIRLLDAARQIRPEVISVHERAVYGVMQFNDHTDQDTVLAAVDEAIASCIIEA